MNNQLNIDWNFTPDNSFILNFKRSNYDPWYAIAELVDNSTGSYERNKQKLDKIFENEEEDMLTVKINYDPQQGEFSIWDNAMGISEENLKRLIKYSVPPPPEKIGRSRYGMGLKTAGWWMGNKIEIRTSYYGDNVQRKIVMDCEKIATGEANLTPIEFPHDKDDHFTKITITDLDKSFRGKTINKITDTLKSIYKRDIMNGNLELWWKSDILIPKAQLCDTNVEGKPYKDKVNIDLGNGRKLTGYLGVLVLGRMAESFCDKNGLDRKNFNAAARKNAGISLFYDNRGIRVYPDAWRPMSLYGEYASNDTINQRLYGELDVSGFDLNHTKDDISWREGELDEVEKQIGIQGQRLRDFSDARKNTGGAGKPPDKNEMKKMSEEVLDQLKKSDVDIFLKKPINKDESQYKKIKEETIKVDVNNTTFTAEMSIGEGTDKKNIKIYSSYSSHHAPYCTVQPSSDSDLIVIVNVAHLYFESLDEIQRKEFLKHIVYDALVNDKLQNNQLKNETDHDILISEKDFLLKKNYTANYT